MVPCVALVAAADFVSPTVAPFEEARVTAAIGGVDDGAHEIVTARRVREAVGKVEHGLLAGQRRLVIDCG
jgi:hypothetical protein